LNVDITPGLKPIFSACTHWQLAVRLVPAAGLKTPVCAARRTLRHRTRARRSTTGAGPRKRVSGRGRRRFGEHRVPSWRSRAAHGYHARSRLPPLSDHPCHHRVHLTLSDIKSLLTSSASPPVSPGRPPRAGPARCSVESTFDEERQCVNDTKSKKWTSNTYLSSSRSTRADLISPNRLAVMPS
jgi:hypothetical protein